MRLLNFEPPYKETVFALSLEADLNHRFCLRFLIGSAEKCKFEIMNILSHYLPGPLTLPSSVYGGSK